MPRLTDKPPNDVSRPDLLRTRGAVSKKDGAEHVAHDLEHDVAVGDVADVSEAAASEVDAMAASTAAHDKVLGTDDTDGKATVTAGGKNAGANNAVHGMGMFRSMQRRLKTGVLVALMGLTFVTSAMVPAQAANLGAVVIERRGDRVRRPDDPVLMELQAQPKSAPPNQDQNSFDPVAVRYTARVHTPPAKVEVVPGRDTPLTVVDPINNQSRDFSTSRGDLPSLLWNDGVIKVEHGTDPGDYYCEHALFTQERYASEVGILKNAQGEPLVGFLHVPDDSQSSLPPDAPIDADARYQAHRNVVGAAFAGYFDAAKAQVRHGAVRILITGYGPFMGITNNPSGGFVSNQANIDAAMRSGFGDRLLSSSGKLLADRRGGEAEQTLSLEYRVKDGDKTRTVVIVAERLDVADSEFVQGDPHSLVGAMRSVKPHAMLSMGVHGGGQFLVEHHADDGGLVLDDKGNGKHDDKHSPTIAFLDNYALARAVYSRAPASGSQTPAAPPPPPPPPDAPALAVVNEDV
jgi:hypothetical protein